MNNVNRLLVLCLLFAFASTASAADQATERTLMFDVFLDGEKIGFHRFDIDGPEPNADVKSEAKFDVKFLFFNAYSYRHTAEEDWSGGCLSEIEARTDANGKALSLSGTRTEDGFVVETGEREAELPACVMTFAYWNPGFLEEPRLLNPQTGEYLEVDVEDLGEDPVQLDGREIPARSYRITARDMDITLWYSEASEWLALESVAKGGRILRYELT